MLPETHLSNDELSATATEPAKKQKAKLSDITNYMTLPQQFGSHTSVQSHMAVCHQKDI